MVRSAGGDVGTIWPVLLPFLAGGGLGAVAGTAGGPRDAALRALAGSARELGWKRHECLDAGNGANHKKDENRVVVPLGVGGWRWLHRSENDLELRVWLFFFSLVDL